MKGEADSHNVELSELPENLVLLQQQCEKKLWHSENVARESELALSKLKEESARQM